MILIYILSWFIFLGFRTIGILLGLLLIPPMAILNKYTTKTETSIVNGRSILNWKYKFMYLWSNNEDGVLEGEEFIGYPKWFRIIYWSAIRNPFNNLRFVSLFSVKPQPSNIQYKLYGKVRNFDGKIISDLSDLTILDDDKYRFVTITNQGLYSNLRIQFKMFNKIWRFWIGWKLYPHDVGGLWEYDYRRFGAGFATQFKRIHPR
jgi:hypothetical protein